MKTSKRPLVTLLIAAASLSIAGLQAGTPSAKSSPGCVYPAPDDDWHFEASIPGWFSGIEGDVGILGRQAHFQQKFADIIRHLDFMAALDLDARKGRWLFQSSLLYVKTSETVQPSGPVGGSILNSAKFSMKQWIIEGDIGYRVVDQSDFTLDAFVGARVTSLSGSLFFDLRGQAQALFGNPTVNSSKTWVDPIIGLAAKKKINDTVSVFAKGDIGGFGAASDLTWQAAAGFEFQLSKSCFLALDYRALGVDYKSGGFKWDTVTHGPELVLGLRF